MKSETRRAQLIGAATKLFSERGYNGTTTKEIASSAGVNEALIFRYFPSKEVLYRGVIDEYVKSSRKPEWHAEIRRCMAEKDDAALFRKLIGYVFEAYRSDPQMQRLIVFAILEGYHKESERACHLPKGLLKEVVRYISERQSEGALYQMDPLGMFQAVFGMARSYAVGRYIYKLNEMKVSDDEAIEMFVQFVIRATHLPKRILRNSPANQAG